MVRRKAESMKVVKTQDGRYAIEGRTGALLDHRYFTRELAELIASRLAVKLA